MASSARSPPPHMPPSERIVQRIADDLDRDPLDLPPLYDAIDPGALNALIETLERGSVTFEYLDNLITVHSDGDVEIVDTIDLTASD